MDWEIPSASYSSSKFSSVSSSSSTSPVYQAVGMYHSSVMYNYFHLGQSPATNNDDGGHHSITIDATKPVDQEMKKMVKMSVFQKSELGKLVFGAVVSVIMGILSLISKDSSEYYSTLSPWLIPFVVSNLTFGSAFIFTGILYREIFQRFASALEELGVALILLGFFALVSSIVPKNLVWMPWLCYFLTVLAFAVLRYKEIGGSSSKIITSNRNQKPIIPFQIRNRA